MKSKVRKYRKTITVFNKLLIIAATLLVCIYTLYQHYEQAIFFQKGNYLLIFLYVVLFLAFAITYGCFRIGILRLRELLFSYALSVTLTNVIFYFVLSLIARTMLDPWRLVLMLVVQLVIALFLYCFANRIYFIVYPARECVVVCADEDKNGPVITKFRKLRGRYLIRKVCNETEGYSQLTKSMEEYSTVILCEINYDLRQKLMSYCFENNKRLFVLPNMQDIMLNNAHQTQIGDSLVYLCKNRGPSTEQLILKRLMDLFFSFIGLIVLSPLMLVTACAIKLNDGGKVFYKQERYTKDAKKFLLLKFRSMVEDAEKDGAQFATKNDSRITKVGKFIRKTRIDELPQLINILKGDMSLVGPRAERVENTEAYCKLMPEFRYRLKMKAGLTGYAQIYGKYNTSFEDKVKMDLLYIERYSLLGDIQLLLTTVKVIFQSESTEGFDQDKNTLSAIEKDQTKE